MMLTGIGLFLHQESFVLTLVNAAVGEASLLMI